MNNMKLTKNKIKEFKNLFLERQKTILDANASRGSEIIDVEGGDEIDLVQGALLKSMADKLSSRDKTNLLNIKEALQRIEDGTFGVCENCEEPIAEKRLIAIPDCKTCINCAEQEEKRLKQFRS